MEYISLKKVSVLIIIMKAYETGSQNPPVNSKKLAVTARPNMLNIYLSPN